MYKERKDWGMLLGPEEGKEDVNGKVGGGEREGVKAKVVEVDGLVDGKWVKVDPMGEKDPFPVPPRVPA